MDQQQPTIKKSNPLKRSSSLLSLEYGFAVVATLASLAAAGSTITTLMGMWTSSASNATSFSALVQSIAGVNYVQTLTLALAAALLGLAAFILFGRVSRAIAGPRAAYIGRVSYKVITYAGFGVLVVLLTSLALSLLGILLSSLVLIGSGTAIGTMYVDQFVPQLIVALVVGMVAWLFYGIVRGKNTSRLLSLGLAGLGTALLIAAIITTAVQSHKKADKPSLFPTENSDRRTPSYTQPDDSSDFLKDFDWSNL